MALLVLGGCARSLVITNATGQPMRATRTVGGEELDVTLEAGDRLVIPLRDEINVNGVVIEVR
jgi:hypothetical protein